MSVIKINAITVAADSGDELAKRFAARAGAVDNAEGFEGFELLKPTDGRTTWLVVTRWRDEESFTAWSTSPAFGQGHRSEAPRAEGADAEASAAEPPKRPVGVSSELWSYVVAGGSAPAAS
jgi:heme oxygenase (mycobilin-producing)